MHIEPGIVSGDKIMLAYATAAVAGTYAVKLAADAIREQGALSLAARTVITSALVFCFFEVFPHYPVGVSEVHLILGSTLFLIFGAAPAAFGLAFGLLAQGLLFAPSDLPQYAMNISTLLFPLFAISVLARKIIAPSTPYVDLRYRQALALSTTYQAGIVAWVAFWAIYGHGFEANNLASIATFGAAYLTVILIEPLADLAVLAAAKALRSVTAYGAVTPRLHNAA